MRIVRLKSPNRECPGHSHGGDAAGSSSCWQVEIVDDRHDV